MKYSIRGFLTLEDETPVIDLINTYKIWKLDPRRDYENNLFTFEVWVNVELDKTTLFNDLKPFVDQYGEFIDWHECTHDEQTHQPCVISEEYRR